MMKWKVTRNPRCASADRSSDYLRKVEEFPDPTLLQSSFGNQQYEKEPLTENRKQSQQGNELFRKPSFVATDCINLKGIFGISKDRSESSYNSLGLLNPGERQRSRSEVRGASADRFSLAYHGNPPLAPQFPARSNGKNKAKETKTRSTSPVDKNKNCWARGRRREREVRKPFLNEDGPKGGRTVVTGTRASTPGKKMANTRTTPDTSGTRNKLKGKKNGRSVSKEKSVARGKENKEINNNDKDPSSCKTETENKMVDVLPQCPPSVSKPKRNTRKKGLAPKPQQSPSQKENPKSGDSFQKISPSTRDDTNRLQTGVNKSDVMGETFNPTKNMVTNVECNSDVPSMSGHENKGMCANEHIKDVHVEKVIVQAEIHLETKSHENTSQSSNEMQTENKIDTPEIKTVTDETKNKMEINVIQEFSRITAVTAKSNPRVLPIIDEPDYTPLNSDDELYNDIEIYDEIKTQENSETANESTKNSIEHEIENEKETFKFEGEEKTLDQSIEEDSREETIEFLRCEQLMVNGNDTRMTAVTSDEKLAVEEEEEETQAMDTTSDAIEIDVKYFEGNFNDTKSNFGNSSYADGNLSGDDMTDTTELDDATLLNMSSDTLVGLTMNNEDCSPTSPTPPPRKKMAPFLEQQLQQNLMTVNVVVRNPPPANGTNISLTSPITSDASKDFAVKKKKSFVLTVAKQEEGFRSLCASRDFLATEAPPEVMGPDNNNDGRISVTFLCSGPTSESWLDSSSSLSNHRLRSVSVPPKNGKAQTEFVSLIQAAAQRSASKDRRTKEKQGSKRKHHKSRKKEALFHMPQAVIDELSQVLETRKRVPDDKPC